MAIENTVSTHVSNAKIYSQELEKEVSIMFKAKIDISDLQKKLAQVTGPDLVRAIAEKVAKEAVEPELAKEPFRAQPYKKMQFVSNKQRAFVMAAIRDGRIEVPYRRTGKIGISEQIQTTKGIDVIVPVAYSDLVRTKGKQSRYHSPLWPLDTEIAAKIESDTAELIGTAAVIEALEKAGLT